MAQRNNSRHSKGPFKAEPDINQDGTECGNNGIHCLFTQFTANNRTDNSVRRMIYSSSIESWSAAVPPVTIGQAFTVFERLRLHADHDIGIDANSCRNITEVE